MKLFTAASLLLATLSICDAKNSSVRRNRNDRNTSKNNSNRNRRLKDKKTKLIKVRQSPPLPGVYISKKLPKVILAQDVDYPPYTGIATDLSLTGFGPDFARGLEQVCKIDVEVVQTSWSECWGSNKIGPGLLNGHFHGCSTYTNVKGVRNRYMEFSKPILAMNKPAGILTRLEGGVPVVDGNSTLNGVAVGDVTGWAPTADVLGVSRNMCTGETFSGYTNVSECNRWT